MVYELKRETNRTAQSQNGRKIKLVNNQEIDILPLRVITTVQKENTHEKDVGHTTKPCDRCQLPQAGFEPDRIIALGKFKDYISIIYVRDNGEIVERFLEFLPNIDHKAKDFENDLLKSLENYGLDIMNCRGQSYDNASNMSDYVPCAAHSLNLVGSCAVESVTEAVDLFSTLQELYNFFTISTYRWEILVQRTNLRVKSLSQTRWSARVDACYALEKEWSAIIDALEFIAKSRDEKPTTRSEVMRLQRKLQHLETIVLMLLLRSFKHLKLMYHPLCRSIVLWLYFFKT
ncbi:hypothetical protein NQ318_019530 [Aromia moschata]|uniref:Uncharacterized protein n=1 Tax=Aromia moschata TaxID=1265417 RepID=A0AAV8XGU8_9CUCU|nr:hypothetical protein NQ318_019530 [Aromia moschata]